MNDASLTNTIYRYHTENDLDQISEIEKVSIIPPWSLNALKDFARQHTSKILVACNNGTVLGYISYSVVLDEIQIANVATHPAVRRRGIAENLLKTLYANAKSNGMKIITLEVRASNTPAIGLYKKCSYEAVGRRKNYYKSPAEDAILMNLSL